MTLTDDEKDHDFQQHAAGATGQNTEESYRRLVEDMPFFIATFRPDGTLTYTNDALAALVALPRAALVGRNFYAFLSVDDQAMVRSRLASLTPEQPVETHEQRYRNPGKPDTFHQWTNRALFDTNGTVVGFQAMGEDISERKQIEIELRTKERYQRALLDNFPFAVWLKDKESRFLAVNKGFARTFGAEIADDLVGKSDFDVAPRDLAERYRADDSAVLASRQQKNVEEEILTKGQLKWFETYKAPVIDDNGDVLGTVGFARDISERKVVEWALREQEEFFHLIAENIGDFIAVVDLEGRRLYNSPSYQRLFGDPDELRGTDSFAEIHPGDRERVKRAFQETVETGRGRPLEYRLVMKDGSVRARESHGNVIKNRDGRVARVVVVAHDVTQRKEMEFQIRQMAFQDMLTNLPNRRLLNDRLNQTMAANTRSGYYGAVLFLDLDNFKPLNDRHGHETGDLLLIEVAERLKHCVREMDTVARFGGDEFVVMISELDVDRAESIAQAGTVAEKIRTVLSDPYFLTIQRDGKTEKALTHHCTASIGVALFIGHEASKDEILKWADAAMYRAKESGRNRVRFYDPDAERRL